MSCLTSSGIVFGSEISVRPSIWSEGLSLVPCIRIVVLSRPRFLSRGKVGRLLIRNYLGCPRGPEPWLLADRCNSIRELVRQTKSVLVLLR